jgi:hypothetical protein
MFIALIWFTLLDISLALLRMLGALGAAYGNKNPTKARRWLRVFTRGVNRKRPVTGPLVHCLPPLRRIATAFITRPYTNA